MRDDSMGSKTKSKASKQTTKLDFMLLLTLSFFKNAIWYKIIYKVKL